MSCVTDISLPLADDTSSEADSVSLVTDKATSVSQSTGSCSEVGEMPKDKAVLELPLMQRHSGESPEGAGASSVLQDKKETQRYAEVSVWYVDAP